MSTQLKQEWIEQDVVQNGVNLTDLGKIIEAIQKDPEVGEFKFRAQNQWIEGGQNQTVLKNYYGACQERTRSTPFVHAADEPPTLLGKDGAANPVEYLLSALASCLTTSLAYQAAMNGVEVESIKSEYEGDLDVKGFLKLDPKARNGYREIRVKFRVKSDASVKQLEEFAKKSPVFDVVTNPTPVKIEFIKE